MKLFEELRAAGDLDFIPANPPAADFTVRFISVPGAYLSTYYANLAVEKLLTNLPYGSAYLAEKVLLDGVDPAPYLSSFFLLTPNLAFKFELTEDAPLTLPD